MKCPYFTPAHEKDVLRLVAQRVALNERLPEGVLCRECDYWVACLYDNLKERCPLGLKEPK